MFKKIKEFHRKTMEAYQKDLEETMEPWKKRVRTLHEISEFLFYYEEMELRKGKGECIIRGEVAKGSCAVGETLYCRNGEGEILAKGIVESVPSEKEEHRKGVFQEKRNEFLFTFSEIHAMEISAMDQKTYSRYLNDILFGLSLMTKEGEELG